MRNFTGTTGLFSIGGTGENIYPVARRVNSAGQRPMASRLRAAAGDPLKFEPPAGAPGAPGAYASAGSGAVALLAKAGITSLAKRSSCSRQRAFGTPTDRLTETRSRPG